jgi:hypothetical protein
MTSHDTNKEIKIDAKTSQIRVDFEDYPGGVGEEEVKLSGKRRLERTPEQDRETKCDGYG